MRTALKTLLAAGLLACAIQATWAAETYELDLQSAVRTALERNPGIASAREGEAIARARLEQARAGGALRVSLGTGYNYLSKPTLFGGMTVMDRETNMNTVSASLPVYTGGRVQAAVEQARWGAAAAGEQARAAREEIALAVTENYLRALTARDNVKVTDEAVAFLESSLDAAVKMQEAGTAPKSDVFRAETDLASARERRIDVQAAYEMQLAVLRNLLSLEPADELALADRLPDLPAADEPSGSDTARPELRAAEDAVKAAEANLRRARAGRKPSVSLNADFLNIGTGAEFPRRSNTVGVGLGASLPLLDGGAISADIAEASAALRRARSDLQAVSRQVEMEQAQARLALRSAEARVATGEARVKSARESARALTVSYQEGIASITDLLGARAALTEAESASIVSTYDRYTARVQVLKSEGHIMTALL